MIYVIMLPKCAEKLEIGRNFVLEQTAREKKGNKKWLPLLVTLVVILAAAGILYGTGVLAAPVFPIGTKVSGVSVSEQSAKEAGETLQQAAEDYKLTVRFAQNTRTFSAKELGLTVDEDALKRLVKVMQQGQNAASAAEDAQTVFTCETDLKEEMQDLPERTAHADKATQDAVLTYDKKARKYVIQEEQVGGTIDTQALAEAVQTAAEQLQPELDAVGAGLYGGETVRRSDDEKLNQALEQANQMLKTDVTYTFEVERKNVYGEEQLNKSAIQKWLTVSEDGKRVQIDEDKVEDYVNEVARIYSVKEPTTAQFVTTSGDHVEVEAPITDESVDTQALKKDILNAIQEGATGQRKAPYRQTRTGEQGTTDLGGTYVEVDLDKQHLYLYVNGKKKAEGDICSGSVADGCATPAGLYTIKTKDYDRYLVGVGYRDWVHCFMSFNGGIGLHDSTWREADEYGGDVYLESGSHGCINMPLELVETVDEYIDVGDYVILYGGQPNRTRQSVWGTKYYTKRRGDAPFRLSASASAGGNLTYTSSNPDVAKVDKNGVVTIQGVGKTEITVTAEPTGNYGRGSMTVTVTVRS